jgi:AsmA protein
MRNVKDQSAPNRPRRHTRRQLWLWGGIVGLAVALPLAAAGIALARFNPNDYAPALSAAVARATGRELAFGGEISLHLGLTPRLVVSNVTLSNPPGGFAGNFITLERAEARIALLPLLRHHLDILQLLLERPQITLQTLPTGSSNWDFSAAPGQAGRVHHLQGYQLALEAVDIRDATITLLPASGRVYRFTLPRLTGTAESLVAPLHLTGEVQLGGQPVALRGTVGAVAALSASAPWPVDLSLASGGASAHLSGAIAQPRHGAGYDFTLTADIPDLAALGTLPSLRQLHLQTEIADRGASFPAINNFSLTAGAADLSAVRPGLTLHGVDVEMAALDQPLSLRASGRLGADEFSIKGALGGPGALLAASPVNLPVALAIQLGAAKADLTGAIATPHKLAGVALVFSAAIPDLAALSAAAGTALPAWKNIIVQATLTDPGGAGLRQAIGLDGLSVSMDHAQLGGDASLVLAPRPQLQLALKFSQLDLDTLAAAAPPAAPGPGWMPPLAWLRRGDAALDLAADTLIWHQLTLTALQGHLALTNGVLTLSPFTGELPGGKVTASASLDASKDPAAETLRISAPALALAPLLHGFGLPAAAQGTAQFQLTAASTGNSWDSIAAGLNGSLGFAAVNGVVDGAAFAPLLGLRQKAGLTAAALTAPGPVPLRCAALRLDVAHGIGTLAALALDSARFRLTGTGTLDFTKQTLAITLHPGVQGWQVDAAVALEGGWAQPVLRTAPALPTPAGDICPAALSLARFGQPGPAALPPGRFTLPALAPMPGAPTNLNAILTQ